MWNDGHREREAHEPVRSTVQGVGFRELEREVGNRRCSFLAEGGGPEGGDTFEAGQTEARSERRARSALSDEGGTVNRPQSGVRGAAVNT